MSDVEFYFENFEGAQKALFEYLHELICTFPGIHTKIRYKIPFYYRKSWVCYLNVVKGGKVELAFLRGNELSNEQGLLESKGRKQVYGIEFSKIEDIPEEALLEIFQEALILDEEVPYSVRKKKKN